MTACAPSLDPEAEEKVLVIGLTGSFETPNELIAQGSDVNDAIVDQFFLPLLRERPDFEVGPPTFEPMVAESWEFSDDRLQLTFHLRPEMRWSDGTPVTAEDVRFTWQAQTSPEVAWNYSLAKDSITDVEVVDPNTVRFHFTRTYATQLLDAVEGVVLPKHVWSELPFERWRDQPEWFLDHLVSSGPFLLEDWQQQQQLVLTRNSTFFQPGKPYLDEVIFRQVREPATLFSQLLTGELDYSAAIRPADARRLEQEPGLTLLTYPARQYTFITWNLTRPQFNDHRVRQALAMAVDRQALVDTLWYGYASIASSPLISNVWAHNDAIEPWPYDPERARRTLTERGWVDRDNDGIREKDGVAFSFELTTNTGNQTRWDAMQMIQAQLREVGVEATLRRIDIAALSAMNLAHDYDATLAAFLIDTSLDLTSTLHSRAIEDGYNYGGYSNPEVDRLIDDSNAVLDQRQAKPLYDRLQQIIHRDQPMLFLWEPWRLIGVKSRFDDIRSNALSDYYALEDWKVATPAALEASVAAP